MNRALAVLLVLGLLVGTVGAAPEMYAIDADHSLTGEGEIARFEETGVVRANLTRIDVGLTVAETSEQAGIEGSYVDANKHYICIDYREGIPRTLRIYYPAAYFEPRVAEPESITSDHVTTIEPTDDREYSALTVAFEGPARACFPVGVEAGAYFGVKGWASGVLANWTGWSPPSIGGGETQWRYVPAGAFANDTYPITHDNTSELTMQYARQHDGEKHWISVPGCDDPADQRVCRYSEDANTTVLLSTQADPPEVRWKPGGDGSADLGSAWNDLTGGFDRAVEWFSGLLGSGGGDDGPTG